MPLSTGLPGAPVRTYKIGAGIDNGQLFCYAQPKDLYALITRSGITIPDTAIGIFDPTVITPMDTSDAVGLWVAGDCDVANSQISFTIVHYESGGSMMGVSPGNSLTSSGFYAHSGRYLSGGADLVIDIFAASSVALIVTSITSGGNWTLRLKPY